MKNIQLLEQLCKTHSVAGDTKHAIEFVKNYLKTQGIDSFENNFGVLLAGNIKNPTTVITAHIDEVGFRVVGKNDNDTFIIKSSGLVTPELLQNSLIYTFNDSSDYIPGAVYASLKIGHNNPKVFDDVILDSSDPNKVKVGDFGSYQRTYIANKEKVIASGLDNKAGVFLLIDYIINNKKFLQKNAVAFVTEEETTYNCIRGVAFQLSPEYMIVLDMIPVHQQKEKINIMPEVGKGPAILQSMYKYHLHESLRNVIKKIKTPYQEVYAEIDFSPEPDAVQFNGKTKGMNVFVPMLGWHNCCYSMDVEDLVKSKNLLSEIVDALEDSK